MSNVYNPDSAGKDRTRLTKTIVLALRELMKQPEPNDQTRDTAAYVVLALDEINKNIDASVEASRAFGLPISFGDAAAKNAKGKRPVCA